MLWPWQKQWPNVRDKFLDKKHFVRSYFIFEFIPLQTSETSELKDNLPIC